MSELLRFFKDMRDNGYGLAEIAAQLGTSAIAEPVAGFAAMYDPVHGADAIREGMTYQPRSEMPKNKALTEFFKTIKPNKYGNITPVQTTPKRPLTEFEQAHLTAQRNAALPVEKGGLGLPADNTAMDRARAMGFDVDNRAYHGTKADIVEFSKKHNAGKTTGSGSFFTDNPSVAATYTGVNGGNTIPVFLRSPEPLNIDVKGGNWSYLKKDLKVNADEIYEQKKINKTLGKLLPDAYKYDDAITTDDLARWANNKGYSSVNFKDVKDRGGEGAFANAQSELPSNNTAIFADHNIRSVNAAFDPKNKWSSKILAQSAKLAPTTALGAYMYNENRKNTKGKQ